MGFLTNLLNPKIAVMYLLLLPQFIDPASGSVLAQSLVLGTTQIVISLSVNAMIAISAGSSLYSSCVVRPSRSSSVGSWEPCWPPSPSKWRPKPGDRLLSRKSESGLIVLEGSKPVQPLRPRRSA